MHRTQLYIDEDILSRVQNISKSLNISISEFIRTAIKNELKKNIKPNMDSFFDSFEALDSFKDIDATEYINEIRSNSRIVSE